MTPLLVVLALLLGIALGYCGTLWRARYLARKHWDTQAAQWRATKANFEQQLMRGCQCPDCQRQRREREARCEN